MRVAVFSYAGAELLSSPAIRARQLAEGLASDLDVTLVAPASGSALPSRVKVQSFESFASRDLSRILTEFDVVIAQKLPARTMRALRRSGTRLVIDLYTPTLAESLVSLDAAPGDGIAHRLASVEVTWQHLALAYGDAFICPGERQRDYWLGLLAAIDRIDVETYRADPSLRLLIASVPFAVPTEPFSSSGGAIRNTLTGIGADDFVLLWSGGIVNWTDPETPIQALARLPDKVKLFFLGFRPPDAPPPVAALRARDLAKELGLLEGRVFFEGAWVPYDERQAYLADADVGIAAYRPTFESRLAFRARLLDYLWAGLPVITTEGDELAAVLEERELARTVAPGDVDGWVGAINDLMDDAVRRGFRARVERERPAFSLEASLAPLRAILRSPRSDGSRFRQRGRLELQTAVARARLRLAARR